MGIPVGGYHLEILFFVLLLEFVESCCDFLEDAVSALVLEFQPETQVLETDFVL